MLRLYEPPCNMTDSQENITVTINGVLRSETERFLSYDPPYDFIAWQTGEMVGRGNHAAGVAPVISFLVNTALKASARHESTLPNEVLDKASTVSGGVRSIVDYGVEQGVFAAAYLGHPALRTLPAWQDHHANITNPDYLVSHGTAPFIEGGAIAGGALRLLRAQEQSDLTENHTSIITRSFGLLVIASLPKVVPGYAKRPITQFGTPYTDQKHLKIKRGFEPQVTLAPKTRDKIKAMRKQVQGVHGCPARNMLLDPDATLTILQDSWLGIVDLLIRPQATVDATA